MSANSSICNRSRLRSIDSSTRGSASEMNPGLLPVEWIEVPPFAHASSTCRRTAGSMLAGRWNSPRVVTMLAPDSRIRHTSSKSQPCCMYRTQSASRARMSSIEFVAITPVLPRAAELTGVLSDLVGRVHVQPDELEVRVFDHRPQRLRPDVPGRPLDDAIRRLAHRLSSLGMIGAHERASHASAGVNSMWSSREATEDPGRLVLEPARAGGAVVLLGEPDVAHPVEDALDADRGPRPGRAAHRDTSGCRVRRRCAPWCVPGRAGTRRGTRTAADRGWRHR